jgi:hypothetical protein
MRLVRHSDERSMIGTRAMGTRSNVLVAAASPAPD